MTKLRAGLSGCGAMGARAVERLRLQDHCDLVALHDADDAAREGLGAATGIGIRAAGFDALLATGVDFVVLCGPPGARLEQVRMAADQGVHCLLHAPMAPDAEAAAAMLAACDAAGVRLGVAVPGHDEPLFEQIRRMIGSDWLGGPVCLQALAGDDALLRDPPRDGDPRVEPRLVGENPFVQLAARHVHLASWLVGRAVVQVTAQTARGFLPIAADGGVATARLRGNVLCTFACSHLTAASELAVHGTDGGVRIDADRIWLRGRQAFHGDVFDYAEPDAETVFPRRELDPVQTRLRPGYELHGRFARWLDDCDDFPCPGDQALIDMRVVDAMARAAALGRAVAVE